VNHGKGGAGRRLVLAAVVAVGGVVLMAAPAGAHALLKSSDPAAGAVLSSAPSRVVLTFTESPDPRLSVVHVVNEAGAQVDRGGTQPVPGHPLELLVRVGALPHGVYTVTWRTVSKVDGHVTGNSFAFGVGARPTVATGSGASTGGTGTTPTPLAVAGRWAFYGGLVVLLGAVLAGSFLDRGFMPRPRDLIAGWLLAAAGLVAMIVAEQRAVGVAYGTLFGTSSGREFVDRVLALLVVGAAVVAVILVKRWPVLLVLGVAVLGAMLVHVLAGHAATSTHVWGRAADIAVQWLHLVSVGVWVGGLVWLLVAVRRLEGERRVRMARRFSMVATVAVVVVAASGATRAFVELGGWSGWRSLFDTSFGWAIVAKIVLFFGLLAFGARNRFVNVPRLTSTPSRVRSLRASVGAEVAFAAAILLATGVLSELPPAAAVAASSARPIQRGVVVSGADFATTVKVRLSVTPGTVGPNHFQVRAVDYDTGRPVPATSVRLQFSRPDRPDLGTPTLDLHRQDGVWVADGTTLSLNGPWQVTVLVQQPGTSTTVPLRVTPKLPPQRITVARASGQPDLYTIALPGGDTIQTYIDPGAPGRNTVHFTFFEPSGDELAIASATATSVTQSGAVAPLPLIRFDPGHFASNTTLTPGRWQFQIQATTTDGRALFGYFEQDIRS
jgi:copper transport protein